MEFCIIKEKGLEMIRFIKWLFTGDAHLHEWEVYKEYKVIVKSQNAKIDGVVLRCKHCGNMKKFQLESC